MWEACWMCIHAYSFWGFDALLMCDSINCIYLSSIATSLNDACNVWLKGYDYALAFFLFQVDQNIGKCRPVFDGFYSASDAVCVVVLEPLVGHFSLLFFFFLFFVLRPVNKLFLYFNLLTKWPNLSFCPSHKDWWISVHQVTKPQFLSFT